MTGNRACRQHSAVDHQHVYATLVHLIEEKGNPRKSPLGFHAEHMGWLVV